MEQPRQERRGPTTLVVEGGHRLAGSIDVEGNKNAALPLLAACLLTDKPCQLTNVPRIKDVGVMLHLLRSLGAEVDGEGSGTLNVCCRHVTTDEPDPRLVGAPTWIRAALWSSPCPTGTCAASGPWW